MEDVASFSSNSCADRHSPEVRVEQSETDNTSSLFEGIGRHEDDVDQKQKLLLPCVTSSASKP